MNLPAYAHLYNQNGMCTSSTSHRRHSLHFYFTVNDFSFINENTRKRHRNVRYYRRTASHKLAATRRVIPFERDICSVFSSFFPWVTKGRLRSERLRAKNATRLLIACSVAHSDVLSTWPSSYTLPLVSRAGALTQISRVSPLHKTPASMIHRALFGRK